MTATTIKLSNGDKIALPYGSTRYPELERFFTIGSLRGFYTDPRYGRNDDVEGAIERQVAKGETRVYAMQDASCLSDSAAMRDRDAAIRAAATRVQYGDVIEVNDGRDVYSVRIERDHNDNVKLVAVEG